MCWSSGKNRTQDTLWSWPCIVRTFFHPSFTLHSFTDKSDEHDTRNWPVLSNSMLCTGRVWPLSVCSSSPVSQSQILIVMSSLAVASSENWG